jgi:hypothetical protein
LSVQNVRVAIERFLSTDTPQVLCIRGAWGTGKTYTWDDVLKKMATDKRIPLAKYAKVSLFGLNSLQEIKREIFQSTISVQQIGKPFDIKEYKDVYAGLKSSGLIFKVLPFLHDNAIDAAVEAAALLARKQLLCIDDLERKGENLRSVDVLGYISQLRDNRACKVVLLLNDEELEDKNEFESYLEKVVDLYLRFEPSGEELAHIAIPEDDKIATLVRDNAITLGINNVRVIRKILGLVRDVAPMLAEYSFRVTMNAADTITLLGWSYLQPEIAPPLEYLKRVDIYTPNQDDNEQHQKWRDLLQGYRYSHTSDFDLLLLRGIQNGYFNKAEIDRHALQLHRADIRETAAKQLKDLWDEVYYSFTEPLAPLLTRLFESYRRNVDNMSLGNMTHLENFFREMGDRRSEDIVDLYIEANENVIGAFEVSGLYYRGNELPKELRDRLVAAEKAQRPALSSDELLIALGTRGFEQDVVASAAELPVSEYIRILKAYQGSQLSDIISGLRQYRNVANPSPAIIGVMTKAANALRTIEKESPLNALRSRRVGLIQWLEKREAGVAVLADGQADGGELISLPQEERPT